MTAVGAAFFLTLLTVFGKILVEDVDPVISAFWRNAVALSLLLIGFILFKKTHLMKTTRLKAHIIRAITGTFGLIMAIWTFQYLPITEGTVLGFTSPFFVILLSYPLLGEKVGIYRVMATVLGLTGVIIIIGFDIQSLTSKGLFIAFGWVLSNSLVLIMLRQLGKTENALTTVFYFLTIGLFLTGLYLPFTDQIMPSSDYIWIALAFGVVGLVSLLLKTESYRHAPASVISPVVYTMLLWTAIFDYFIWDRVASPYIWLGAGIIIVSNLIIVWRERRLNKD